MCSDGLRLDNRGLLALDRLYRSHGLFDIAQRVRRERSMHAARDDEVPFEGATSAWAQLP